MFTASEVATETCTLCQVPDDELTLVRTAAGIVRLHEDWAVRGHAMVISPRHVENLSDLTEGEAVEFLKLHRRAETALLSATGTSRAVVMKLGLATPHLHLHIYPVGVSATRAEVFAAIDMKVRDELRAEERSRFIELLRTRFASTN